MNKALLPLLLCCFIFPASGKDAGWQWYNEKINPKEKENKPVPAAPRQEPDIMQKLAALQTATKRALYEAILYPGVDNFVKYFRLQNYWTQQAGLFTMSAKKAMLAHPELDYNLQYSHYNGTVRNQLAADQVQQRQAIAERTKATVTTDNVAALRQGTSGAKIQTSTETGNQHKYQTRVVSNANKVNLKFEEAKPVLEDQLAKSIANIL